MKQNACCVSAAVMIYAIVLLPVLGFSEPATNSVPTNWLDSIASALQLIDSTSAVQSMKVLSITERLDSDGEVKDSDSTFLQIVRENDSTFAVFTIEPDGEILEEITPENSDDDEEFDPYSVFYPEQRSDYSFTRDSMNSGSRFRISFEPNSRVESGFRGSIEIDTMDWKPLRLTGSPLEPPSPVREMEMEMIFGPPKTGSMMGGVFSFALDQNLQEDRQTWSVQEVVVTGRARIALVINVRFRQTQQFFDRQLAVQPSGGQAE